MDRLAKFGGPQACPPGTVPPWPQWGDDEVARLCSVLESGKWWRVAGREVESFEREFASFHGCREALAVSSGTDALELALSSIGVGPGDEVVVPAFTFCATATAVLAVGAIPVAADIDAETYCLSPSSARQAITSRSRAIVPVHLAGHPYDIEAIEEIAEEHGLAVVADAAHAHGARWRNTSVAGLCRASIYSFQAMKLLTAGEGGALVSDDPDLMERAWLLHTSGRPRGDRSYRHLALAGNARMTEFQGAILRAQLRRLPAQLGAREEGGRRLDAAVASIQGLRVLRRHPGVTLHSNYMYIIELDEHLAGVRDEVVDLLAVEGVPAFRAYRALPDLELFVEDALQRGLPPAADPHRVREAIARVKVPHARAASRRSLWLHHSVLLGAPSIQEKVGVALAKVAAYARSGALENDAVPMMKSGR